MSINVRARAKSTDAPRSVARPAARSARPNPTLSARRRRPSTSGPHGARTIAGSSASRGVVMVVVSGGCARLLEVGSSGRASDATDVLFVLEDDTERFVHDFAGELPRPEGQEGGRPVERLGDAGDLREVGITQAMDEGDDLVREL